MPESTLPTPQASDVFVSCAREDRGVAQSMAAALADRLRAAGYAVPAVEVVGARAPARSEVRLQGGSSPGWWRWLAKVVGEVTGEPAHLATLRSARPDNDTCEIWLDKDLCHTRRVSGC
jgi:hypothetical protein